MKSKPKLMVIQLKELIFTLIFVILGILIIVFLLSLFSDNEDSAATSSYVPGTYSTSLTIGSIPMEMSVKVDSERIVDVALTPASESVETMYPLLDSSVSSLREQLLSLQDASQIAVSADSQYTYTVLMDAVNTALAKAYN